MKKESFITNNATTTETARWRFHLIFVLFIVFTGLIIARLIHLQVAHTDFLQQQGKARTVRIVDIPSYRGMITDRRGTPIAISTPVYAVWMNPKHYEPTKKQVKELAKCLELTPQALQEKIAPHAHRAFLYLKRGVTPDVAEKIQALGISGIALKKEFRRYYPAGREAGQLVGFTDIDDKGQGGLELTYEDILKPTIGKKRVLEDRTGKWVQDIHYLQAAQSGADIALSIDLRIQGVALRELEKAVKQYQAKSATLVMLDVRTGEILAMVSAPSFNPNNRNEYTGSAVRNRALTDQIEPGSTIKPFSIVSALATRQFTSETLIDTTGPYYVGHHHIKDISRNGIMNVRTILSKSSNIGISKITLALPSEKLIETFSALGFGQGILTPFPGERQGMLPPPPKHPLAHATLAFGYGLTVTPLQLAHAYATLAAKGVKRPVSLLKIDDASQIDAEQALPADVAQDTLMMLTQVLTTGGSGTRAHIPGYQTAGKTGTTRVVGPHGYDAHRHIALFAGITPVDNPRLVTIIMVEEPNEAHYYGGLVAAPIYKNVVGKALYMLNIPPDNALS